MGSAKHLSQPASSCAAACTREERTLWDIKRTGKWLCIVKTPPRHRCVCFTLRRAVCCAVLRGFGSCGCEGVVVF